MENDTNIYEEKNKMPTVLPGKKILVFGDTHFDDNFQGKHVDYEKNTRRVMKQIKQIYDEEKPDWVILAGDLIGVKRGRSKTTTRQYLKDVIVFLDSIGGSKGRLVVVKGNHDYNVESDYNFLEGIKTFKAPRIDKDVMYFNPSGLENQLFIHLRNYGDENQNILDKDQDTSEYYRAKKQGNNVVVAHNDFYVKGEAEGYVGEQSIELNTFRPFAGADLVLSGHIHTPGISTHAYEAEGTNKTGYFLNLGCPSRPSSAEKYNAVWYCSLNYRDDKETWDIEPKRMKLLDYHKEFVNDDNLMNGVKGMVDKSADKESEERLSSVLNLLEEGQGQGLDLSDSKRQLDFIKYGRPHAVELAKGYIDKAQSKY